MQVLVLLQRPWPRRARSCYLPPSLATLRAAGLYCVRAKLVEAASPTSKRVRSCGLRLERPPRLVGHVAGHVAGRGRAPGLGRPAPKAEPSVQAPQGLWLLPQQGEEGQAQGRTSDSASASALTVALLQRQRQRQGPRWTQGQALLPAVVIALRRAVRPCVSGPDPGLVWPLEGLWQAAGSTF